VTRAVIELTDEINFAMPKLSKAIEGAAYNPEGREMAFRIQDFPVVIDGLKMTIVNADNEEKARMVLGWLTDLYNDKPLSSLISG
jgi:hypothetical protein